MVQALVMAGGRGERLTPLTLRRPKPLVPLFGRPLLGYLLQHLREQGVDEIFVTAGHLGEQICRFVAGSAAPGVRCRVEAEPRGTAGAVADLLPELRTPFLVVSGDAVVDLDVAALLAAHAGARNLATICLAPPGERLRFGTVNVEGGRVVGFSEKPSLARLLPSAGVNTGCYMLEREALAGIRPDAPADFARDVFPALLRRGDRVGAASAARYWRDIGTLESYRETHFEGVRGALPWRLPPEDAITLDAAGGPVRLGRGVVLAPGARVTGPAVIGAGCRIGPAATVTRSVLLDGARVAAGAMVRDCVIDAGAVVAAGMQAAGAGLAGRPAPRRTVRSRRRPVGQGDGVVREPAIAAPAP